MFPSHKTSWYPLQLVGDNYTPIIENVRTLCKRMIDDYKTGSNLMNEFPNRVQFIRYEDLVSIFRQTNFNKLNSFLGLQDRLFKEKVGNGNFKWRYLLQRSVIDIVDTECSRVYETLGYIRLGDDDLQNNNVYPFIPYFLLI